MSFAAILLPLLAAADSSVQSGSGNKGLSASAHLDFKIIIPRVLSLNVDEQSARVTGAQSVSIYSNSRTVTLAASLASNESARGNLILNSAARKVIEREAACALGASSTTLAGAPARALCTVSMP
jgi:hypothetical protein